MAKLTPGQKANKKRMVDIQKEVKKIKAKNSKISHTDAVSKAWKQYKK